MIAAACRESEGHMRNSGRSVSVLLMIAVLWACSSAQPKPESPAAPTPPPTATATPDPLAGAKKLKRVVKEDATTQQVVRAMGEPDDKKSWEKTSWIPFAKPERGTTYFYRGVGRVVFNEAGHVSSIEPNPDESGIAPENYP